jgi:uncharacterized hydrophobic protein (TIGR00271 family)
VTRNPGLAGTEEAHFSAGGRHAARDGARRDGSDGGGGIDHALLLASVARDARLDRKYLLLITLSAGIATLGLLQNSPAVVIGAMLVSPLLGPIMGIGFGLVTLESALVRRSVLTLAAGMGVAVMVAMAIVWLSPVQDVTSELRARTRPTLLDLGVAVVGGVAGVYAIIRQLSGVMVGVAIATALVPPLSTIGFGLATWRTDFALGAALLFLTNTLAIAFAATLVARMNHFGPSLTRQHTMMQVVGIVTVLGLLSIPLAISLNAIALEIRARSTVQSALEQLLGDRDRLDTLSVNEDGDGVRVDGVVLVDRFRPDLSHQLAAQASRRLGREVQASIVQLRQQSDIAAEHEAKVNQRLEALERRDEESAAVLADLAIGGLIERRAITLDPQLRRAVVILAPENENERVLEAIDTVIRAAQAKHPGWLITASRANDDGALPAN